MSHKDEQLPDKLTLFSSLVVLDSEMKIWSSLVFAEAK